MGTSGPHFGAPRNSFTYFSYFFESLSSLFSSLFFLSFIIYVIIVILSSLFSLLSSLFSLRSSFWSFRRRGGFRVANWDPPAPAWPGSRACEIGARLHQISSEFELRQAPRIPPTPAVLPRCWPIPIAQNAILEPPMASKMPSWSLRWPPDRQILQMSAKIC